MANTIDTQALQGIELFDKLTPDDLGGLLPACDELAVSAGQTIFEAGQQERALYVLLAGTAEVDLEPPRAGERVLAELPAGSVFGESSFFHASPHSATVKARSDVRLLQLNRDKFDGLLQGGNLAALRIAANAAAILAARLQQADRFIVELLEQIQDEKVREAVTRFRNTMSHSFASTVRPSMQVGAMQ
jgi:CRP/FNR family transcriptional regulator, cyclic AMP receptor protein